MAASLSPVATRAAEDEKPVLTFGLITDVQYADVAPNRERHYRESPGKLKDAVAWLAKQNLPFTLHLGDFIDRDYAAFATVLPLLEPLGHPVKHLMGNHDYDVADGEKAKIVATLGMPADYYSFSQSGIRFVMLDTNDLSVYKYPEGSPKDVEATAVLAGLASRNLPNAKPWNGGLSQAQLQWLDKELSTADAAKERVILCGHHPLQPADGYEVWESQGLLDLIDKHPSVSAYFCGHQHGGAEVVRNGVPYITFKSVLHEPGVNSYSAIRIFKDKLEIVGNGREISRSLALKTA